MEAAAVTGLDAEARIARRAGIAAEPSGGVASQTTAIAENFLRNGAEALLSFGIAGALAPSLPGGTILLPRAVIDDGGTRHTVDPAWHASASQALRRAGLSFAEGDVLGATEPAVSAEVKAALLRATQAVAVDLESHLIAAAAERAGKPFLVLRAIADPASRALPPAAVNGLDARGKPALGPVLVSVLRQPGQIPALLRLAGDTRRALAALVSALAAHPL